MKIWAIILCTILFAAFANASNNIVNLIPLKETQSTPTPTPTPQQQFVVSDAWTRTSSTPQNFTTVYMTIQNNSVNPCEIVAVSSHMANSIQIVQSFVDEDGVSKSAVLDKILIPANSTITLQPSGIHIVLYKLKTSIKIGMKVPVSLYLKDGRIFRVSATVTNQQ